MEIKIKKHTVFSLEVIEIKTNIDISIYIKELYKIRSEFPKSVNKSNKGGYQTNNNLQNHPTFRTLLQQINNYIENYFKKHSHIEGLWGNISSTFHYNDPHTHTTRPTYMPPISEYSGVFYLQTPKNSGDIVFRHPLDINIVYPYTPIQNTLLLFPSYTIHGVDPNLSNEDRISIAFNFKLKNND